MKNILKLMALFAFLLCFISCDEDEKAEIPTLPVTAANLNGTWQLSEWNGQPMAEGTYCYITFNRKELTFEMYQKFDSMYARHITGHFSLENDPYLEYNGEDQQLNRAIQVILEKLKTEKKEIPSIPAFPNKAAKKK